MANNQRIVDPVVDNLELAAGQSLADHLEAEVSDNQESEVEETSAPAQTSNIDIPERFQGKSIEEVVASYRELEAKFGQQGNEMGELRKLADQLLTRDLHQQAPKSDDLDLDETDFITSPQEAVNKLVQQRLEQELGPLKKQLEETKNQQTLATLETKHPEMREIVAEPAFQEWILSSNARQQNWQAASAGDFDQADELFRQYKEYVRPKKEVKASDPALQQAAKTQEQLNELETAAALDTGNAKTGPDGAKRKPVFQRARLIRMQLEEPLRYRELQPEIMLAYQEGRVV